MATMGTDNLGYGTRPGGGSRLAYQFEDDALQGDAILPVQFYNGRRGAAGLEPMKRLMMAVLVDAIGCYQRHLGTMAARKRREFKEAECWLFKDKRDDLFSFEHVCDVLNIDPDRLREAILQWQRTTIPGLPPRRITRRRR